ncbi:hypothetical protein [Streptomyces canus]|uniref:hypothetical protein n=1 Tax=Streptomyces canus TaxID=58343 RepID=UPI002E32C70B|nr:hypothetical protein [Streptomyces canus]
MSGNAEFTGAHRDLMDGRADLPRVGAVLEGTAASLPYVVADGASREIEPVSRFDEGWRGEVEGLDLTLRFLGSKRAQAHRAAATASVDLGMPTRPRAGR